MIKESAVYHFIDQKKQYALTIFNGSKFMLDLATWQNFSSKEITALRPLILSLQSMITVVKNNESFGAYVSNEDNSIKFNLEAHANGHSRLLLKNSIEIPEKLNGICRFIKFQPNESNPYTSIIELKNSSMREVTKKIIENSYQFDAHIEIIEENDLCFLMTKFPDYQGDFKKVLPSAEVNKKIVEQFATATDEEQLINSIQNLGYTFLSLKRIELKCTCSKDKVVMTFRSLTQDSKDELFEDTAEIEINCDYCGTPYKLKESDLKLQ